jgi:P4 family phage/plasmid primase-like protien
MYDIQLIKSRISCVDVAKRCGLPIDKPGDRCVSPFREGAKNPTSFSVDEDFWFDFGDSRGGDCIDLLAELRYRGNRGHAIRELASLTGVQDSNPRPDGWHEYTQNLCNQIAYWQTQLTEDDYNYLHSRGLTDDTISQLKIGRTNDGRLSIPYRKNGYVAYYCTRYLPGGAYPESKYRKQRRDEYNENIPWGMETLSRNHDTLIIAEGAFDAISFYQDGYPVISAITGFFSKTQIPTVISIARKFKRVLIVYDDDSATSNAGAKFTMRMSELLISRRIPFVVGTVPKPHHDVSDYYAAGGDLKYIVDNSEDGLFYIASKITTFDALEKFIFTTARHTKRTLMENLLSHLKRTTTFDGKLLDSLFRTALTAPPETIIADEITRDHQLVYVHAVGFYEYSGSVWNRINDGIISGYADRAYGEFSTANRITAITKLLKTRVLSEVTFNTKPLWNFINGTLELDTGTFREHSAADYCSFISDYPYNPDASYHSWSRFIDDVTASDPVKSEILQFIPAYALMPHCKFEKVFCLCGSGGNGKSKYLEILRRLFGESNVTHVTPRGLLDRFQRIALKDSLINIAGEIKSDVRDAEEYIKLIASGEPISACFKSQDFVPFVSRSKLLFAMNGQLTSSDTSDGLTRRIIIVDFKVSFVDFPDPRDPYQKAKNVDIIDGLLQELQSGGIFNWVYEGYKLLSKVGYFTETHDQAALISDFKRASNPVLVFWEDCYEGSDAVEILYEQLYSDYITWCSTMGETPISSQRFHSEVKNITKNRYVTNTRSVRVDGKPRKQRYYRLQTT